MKASTFGLPLLLLLRLAPQCEAATSVWQNLLDAVSSEHEPKIVGGVPSNGYPAFGSPAGNPLCGCTLIYPDIALTAAHCRGSFLGQTIYFGGTIVDGRDAYDAALAIGEFPFPDFEYQLQRHDIMLIQLSHPIQNVAPAKWNTDPVAPLDNTMVKTIGYGDTHPRRGQPSDELLEIVVPVVSSNECNGPEAYDNMIDDTTMICAGSFQIDSCNGDSGNPLLDTATGIVVGVVSFGVRCGSERHPGVYTRVSAYDSYLREGICALSIDPPCGCDGSCPTLPTTNDNEPEPGDFGAILEVSPGTPPSPTLAPARATFQPVSSPPPPSTTSAFPRPIILEPPPIVQNTNPQPTATPVIIEPSSSSWTRRRTAWMATTIALFVWL